MRHQSSKFIYVLQEPNKRLSTPHRVQRNSHFFGLCWPGNRRWPIGEGGGESGRRAFYNLKLHRWASLICQRHRVIRKRFFILSNLTNFRNASLLISPIRVVSISHSSYAFTRDETIDRSYGENPSCGLVTLKVPSQMTRWGGKNDACPALVSWKY